MNIDKDIQTHADLQSMLEDSQEKLKFSIEDNLDKFQSEIARKFEGEIFSKQASNGDIVFGYLMHDSNPQPFFEDDDDVLGQFVQFKSQEHVDSTMKKIGKKLFFLVDKYEHGNVHYSVAKTQYYPDNRWDVSHNCGVFIPCSYTQSEYKKAVKANNGEEAMKKFLKEANDTLNSYSDWCNGEVYGVDIKKITKDGNIVEEYSSWGYVGSKNAISELSGFISSIVKDIELTEKLKDVVAKDLNIQKTDLPFRIAKKGLLGGKVYTVDNSIVVAALYEQDNASVYVFKEGQEKADRFKFEEWQKKHKVSPTQYLQGRSESELKRIIEARELVQNLEQDNPVSPSVKTKMK